MAVDQVFLDRWCVMFDSADTNVPDTMSNDSVLGPIMSPILKPCGLQLEPKLLPNGSNLGRSCAILEPRWARSWSLGGPSWVEVEALARSNRCIWTMLCRYGKGALPQRGAGFWRSPERTRPPQLKLYQSLLNYAKLPGTTPRHLWCRRI